MNTAKTKGGGSVKFLSVIMIPKRRFQFYKLQRHISENNHIIIFKIISL